MNASGSRTSLPRLALVGVVASLLALAVLPCSAAGEDAAAVAREQRAHEAQVLVAQGRQYLGAKHYAEARDAFERALRLTPGDAACAKLLAQARTALGTGSQTAILDHMRERRETTGRMIALQLDTTLFEAERELKANPESAAERAQRVLEGVAYVRDAQRAAELRRRAEEALAKAKTQRDDKLDAVRTRELAKAREAAHRNAGVRNAQLRAMREQAWKFLEANNQDKARELAEAMLHIDPSNPDAQKLQEELRQARVAVPASLQGMSAGRKKAMTEFMSEVERELIPLEAAEIVRAGRTRGEPKDLFARPMEKWERDLREKLREPIEMAFRGTPLDAAVKQIAEVAGITVIVDPEAQNGKEPVYFDARMPAESLLRWVGRFGGLEYQLRDGAVVLAQPGGVLDEPVRRTYDISSLVTPPNEPEPPPQVGPVEPVSVVHAAPGGNSTVNPDIIGQGWADYLKNTVAAETWGQVLQERPQYTINYRNGRIVVVHTPEVHAEIEQLLNNFRRARNLQVHMVGRFVEINAAYLDSFNFEIGSFDSNGTFGDPVPDPDGKWKSIVGLTDNAPDRQALTRFPNFFSGGDGLHLEYTRLGDSDVSLLLEAVMKKRQGTILTAPRLTCFNTQRANLRCSSTTTTSAA